jgi:CRISPR/Cas system CSM-associated protein Csm2 small subunit
MSKPTTGQWETFITASPFIDGHTIECNGMMIAHVEGWRDNDTSRVESEANAIRIVNAVNQYDELVEAVEQAWLQMVYDLWDRKSKQQQDAFQKVSLALQKAKP